MTAHNNADPGLAELQKERTFGGMGETKARDVPRIDFSDFEARKAEIADQLWRASTDIGFFQLVNHGIPQAQIDEAFEMTERFFALPHETKVQLRCGKGTNAGWEYKSQVRPSTGTADHKESYQITLPRMTKLWPSGDELPGFKAAMLAFERANWAVGMKVLSCFALKARLHAGLFHRVPRSALARIPEDAAASALHADGRRQARGLHRLARRRAYRFRLSDAAASARRPRRPAALPRQENRPNSNGPT